MRRILILTAIVGLASVVTSRAEEPTHAFMTASDGVKIHYMEMGRGTPVILIHGYTANSEGKWFKSGIAQALAPRWMRAAMDRATNRTIRRSTGRAWPLTSSS